MKMRKPKGEGRGFGERREEREGGKFEKWWRKFLRGTSESECRGATSSNANLVLT